MADNDIAARVVELLQKWQRLKKWGVAEKLPFTRETQKDLDKFFQDARDGKLNLSEIEGTTLDIRRLEGLAEDYDNAHGIAQPFKGAAPKTKYDAGEDNAAKPVVEAATDAKVIAKDFAKETGDVLAKGAKAVPWWAWLAGGTVLVTYILTQVATISRVVGGNRK